MPHTKQKNSIHTSEIVDHFFRHESARIVAHLTRKFGSDRLEHIEDAVQDSLLKAMQTWPFSGIPDNPSGWILVCSQNRLLDILKRKSNTSKISLSTEGINDISDDTQVNNPKLAHQLNDDLLSMMFACCHPSLSAEFQVVLTLKILCGFGKREIAKALLKSEEAIAKSYTRARSKFKSNNTFLNVPIGKNLNDRLDSVLKVLYLLFNEGYHSLHEELLVRKDVCAEAIRLTQVILDHKLLKKPNVHALMALMCFQASRLSSRVNEQGALVILENQDRSLWSKELIQLGLYHIEKSAAFGILSEYHLQASIAAIHCTATSYKKTNWKQILLLYDVLLKVKPNEIVAINRIVAYGKVHGAHKALNELDLISHNKNLLQNHLFFSIKASLYEETNNIEVAIKYYRSALTLIMNKTERTFIKGKIDRLMNEKT